MHSHKLQRCHYPKLHSRPTHRSSRWKSVINSFSFLQTGWRNNSCFACLTFYHVWEEDLKLCSILKGHEKYLQDKCFRITKCFFGLISSAHFCTCEIEGGVVGGKHASYGFVPTMTVCCKEPRCCLCCMAFCSIPPMNPWNLQQWKTNVQLQQWQSETSHYQAAVPNVCSCCEALDASTLLQHRLDHSANTRSRPREVVLVYFLMAISLSPWQKSWHLSRQGLPFSTHYLHAQWEFVSTNRGKTFHMGSSSLHHPWKTLFPEALSYNSQHC